MAVAELSPTEAAPEADEQTGEQEAPSVFSVVNRHIVGRCDVSPPFEDGSRVLRLYSANGGTIIEANLSQQVCEFVSNKLVEVEIIAEGDEDASDSAD